MVARGSVDQHLFTRQIKPAYASSSEPEQTGAIFEYARYKIAAEAVGVSRIDLIVDELACCLIVAIESAFPGADPQIADTVFEYRGNNVIHDTARVSRLIVVVFEELPLA